MPVLTPENRYSSRINAALNFAQSNVNANLDMLADTACLSKFHFLRLFQDQLGESPVSFLKRVRLERAACLLAYAHNRSVLDIASHCGFSTSQHFSRAFSKKFGCCPRQYRSKRRFNSKGNIDLLIQRFQSNGIHYDEHSTSDQVDIVKSPTIRVAYVRSIGKYFGDSEYSQNHNNGARDANELVVRWAKRHSLLSKETKVIAVTWDYSSLTPASMCRYDACIQIPDNYMDTSDISTQTLPGGVFATMRTSIEPGDNFFLKWKLFDLILSSSSKFKQYQFESNMGPWYTILKPIVPDEKPEVTLCSHLLPRTAAVRYPLC